MKAQPVAGLALGAGLFSAAAGRLPQPQRPSERDGALLIAAACAAAVEELFWRGALPRLLRRAPTGVTFASTSIGFVLAHRRHSRGPALITHALLAVALGSVAARRNGLATAVVAHATYDVLVLLERAPT